MLAQLRQKSVQMQLQLHKSVERWSDCPKKNKSLCTLLCRAHVDVSEEPDLYLLSQW